MIGSKLSNNKSWNIFTLKQKILYQFLFYFGIIGVPLTVVNIHMPIDQLEHILMLCVMMVCFYIYFSLSVIPLEKYIVLKHEAKQKKIIQ